MASKKNKFEPINLNAFLSYFNTLLSIQMPIDAIVDISKWATIFKSPSSYSFYSKQKDWFKTQHETIRISDHWNFLSSRNKEAQEKTENWSADHIHCKTDINIYSQWAMGIFDAETHVYKIVKLYNIENNDKTILYKLKEEILKKIKAYNKANYKKFSSDLIEKRRNLKLEMIYDRVILIDENNNTGFIKKIGSRGNRGRKCIETIINGEEKIIYLDTVNKLRINAYGKDYTLEEFKNEGYF